VRHVRARIVLLLAIAGVLLYAYPGLMTADSGDQLLGARQWELGDWQPPVMSVVWRGVDAIWSGPLGMLLIQVIGATLGAAAILRARMSATLAAGIALGLMWYPPVLSVVGVIWKDNQMAAFALLGIAGLVSPRPWPRRLALAALWLATAMRHNAAAATLAPVLLLWRHDRFLGARRWAAAAGVWVLITATAFGTNALLTRTHEHPWTRSIATTDIVGVIRWAPPLSDDELRTELASAPLRVDHDIQRAAIASYDPRGWNRYFQSSAPILAMPQTPAELAAIDRAWRDLVAAHPGAYLRHRWTVFEYLLKLRGSRKFLPTTSFTDQENPGMAQALGLDPRPNAIQRGLFAAVAAVPGIFYLPFLYLLLDLLLALVLLVVARRDRLVVALLASGVLYELGYFIAAPSVDYRYSVWLITTTVLAAALVIQRLVQGPIGSMRGAGVDTNIVARAAASGGGAGSAAEPAEPEPAAEPADPEP
jgi:hypothetical protein